MLPNFTADATSLATLDHQHLWHPFTQQQEWVKKDPLIIVSGKGAFLDDIHGKKYFDGNSSIWTNIHGHAHPHIVAAIAEQASRLDHTSFLGTTHPKAIILAERLVKLFPGSPLSRVFFSDNGSTAIEVALKMTLQYWQLTGHPERQRFVSFTSSYHGDTAGAASLSGKNIFSERFAKIHFPVEQVTDLSMLERLPHPQTIAAIVIEPLIQGVAGMRLWPKGMLRDLRSFCDRLGILLILDEVMTGFGRTGKMFACQHEGVIPDFIALAKGLTGGALPLAATMTREKIYEAFLGTVEEQKTFYYGHSYTANPIACAAALASLEIFEEESVLEKLPKKIECFSHSLKKLESLPHVAPIRQCGLIAGIELMQEPHASISYRWHDQVGAEICYKARHHGLLTRPILDTIVFMPPLCATEEEISNAVEGLFLTLQTL
ncbi:MAG: adenosylmethionine--8-amino-7-oxononanoate transaminase [Chthoniobacterales bacterium]|nr:adenosylmethionine--8-amino-7-oxononanoate transaminase [Chthoniobacterales bacterium]